VEFICHQAYGAFYAYCNTRESLPHSPSSPCQNFDGSLSRSSIYAKAARGEFPRPVSLGARAVGWLSSDVEGWIADRVKLSRDKSSEDAR
jgi:prophage regulatory protein